MPYGQEAGRSGRRGKTAPGAGAPAAGDKAPGTGSGILRGLAIIEAVVAAQRAVSPADLVDLVGLPKATVYRLCGLLEREGVLQRNLAGSGLTAGPRLAGLAQGVLAGTAQRVARKAVLKALSDAVGETCNITLPDGTEMIYFDRVEAQWPLRLQLPTGSRVPLHCTASGKLFLSSLPGPKRRRLIHRLPLERHTANTLTDPEALEADLKRIRADQVGTDNEEFLEGMVAVSVPLTDPEGRLYATLAVHAPVVRVTFEQIKTHVPAMRRAAAELSVLAGSGAADDEP